MTATQMASANPSEGAATATTLVTSKAPESQQQAGQQQQGSNTTTTAQAKVEPSYEFKSPEGVSFDAEVLKTYGDAAKELQLAPEAAQKLLDRIAPAMQERQSKQLDQMRTEWMETSKADKEFGGAKLQENLATAKKALDAFGSQALRDLLNESGLGNHPEVIRFFLKAGKAIDTDRYVGGSRQAAQSVQSGDFSTYADALYPTKK
jgi:hypothetical protein